MVLILFLIQQLFVLVLSWFLEWMRAFLEDLSAAQACRGISTHLAVFCTQKSNKVSTEGISLGEEDGDLVGRGLHRKGCRLRRGLVPGKDRVGVLLGHEWGGRGAWAGSSDLGTVSTLVLTVGHPLFSFWNTCGLSVHICAMLKPPRGLPQAYCLPHTSPPKGNEQPHAFSSVWSLRHCSRQW